MPYLNRLVRLPQGVSRSPRCAVVISYTPAESMTAICAVARYEDNDEEVYLNRRMMDEYACVSVVTESCS